MASEDVIELGSSEDEAAPAPKRKKPMPNAMVHIPTKLPEITIKPTKMLTKQKTLIIPSNALMEPRGVLPKPIIINKSNKGPTAKISKQMPNSALQGRPTPIKSFPKNIKIAPPPQLRFPSTPISIARNVIRPQVNKRVTSNNKLLNPLAMQRPKLLNNLPPSITIKPMSNIGTFGNRKKQDATTVLNSVGDVLTVELDDEEMSNAPTHNSPLWYLRPEEQEENQIIINNSDSDVNDCKSNAGLSLEEQNNKEPEPSNFVEITIEDSPIKPLPPKNISEKSKEQSIVIEDSPVKPIKNIKSPNEDSDSEHIMDREPQSKKKLNYPKTRSEPREVVEIEIDINETGSFNDNENEKVIDKEIDLSNNQSQNKEVPQNEATAMSSMDTVQQESKEKDNEASDFHPAYQKFIDTCFKLENSADMTKIVEKKIKAYYKQCPKEYVESEQFIDMVSSKMSLMKTAPDKMYLYIKDIVDELNLQRKIWKVTAPMTENTMSETHKDKAKFGDKIEYDERKCRQIRKLEKTIKKLHRAITKLEEQEVDLEDDEDSVYLLTERYKERMVRVYAKFCQLTNTKMPSEPRIHLEARPGRPTGAVKKLEKWINRNVPIGAPLPFPDFHDVLGFVREANNEDKLGWSEMEIMDEARDLFTRCGKKLQRRRQENEWRLAASRIVQEKDPAEEDAELKKKLDENISSSCIKEAELINKFVDRQNQLKLVPEEIGDKEAEESPVESDEEEFVEKTSSMEEKLKRKERLKRLIQERSRTSEEKENNPEKEENNIESKKQLSNQVETDTKSKDDADKMDTSDIVAPEPSEQIPCEVEKNEGNNIEGDMICDIDQESDGNEMDLLEKLCSASDSDSCISTPYTLESDSTEDFENVDVISIENSSCSDLEAIDIVKNTEDNTAGTDYKGNLAPHKDNVFEQNEIIEKIQFESSDEETYINLKDDEIFISETTVNSCFEKDNNKEDNVSENNNAVLIDECPDGTDIQQGAPIEYLAEQENGLNDFAMECSNVEVIKPTESAQDEIETTTISDGHSVDSADLQTEQIQPETISNETEDSNNVISCIDETDVNDIEMQDPPANIEA